LTVDGIDIGDVLVGFLAIVMSITFHEFAHAFVADRLGDPTPRKHGRLTLNPVVLWRNYPVGALVAPLLGAFSGFLMGWAATPVNPALVNRKYTIRKANFLISVAGPASNVLLGLISVGLVVGLYPLASSPESFFAPLFKLANMLVMANVILAVFNLLPIPPLDGYTVLEALAPPSWETPLRYLREFSFMILLLVILRGSFLFSPILNGVFRTVGGLVRWVHG
jgi:Zn-dependent protease